MFYFGANTKLLHTPDESVAFVREIANLASSGAVPSDVQLWYAPPYTSLIAVADMCRLNTIHLTAQNCHWSNVGGATGEISPRVLKACGVEMVMLGHAERRKEFADANQRINTKVLAALAEGLRVMLCVGETLLEDQYGIAQNAIAAQLRIALHGIEANAVERLLVLYEPVSAIGNTGAPADPRDVAGAFRLIRDELNALFGTHGSTVPLLYGGSVNVVNARRFAEIPACNGMGVSRSGSTAEGFIAVLSAALDTSPNDFETD
jgi:L-erythrulose 1-phosphate isomerase